MNQIVQSILNKIEDIQEIVEDREKKIGGVHNSKTPTKNNLSDKKKEKKNSTPDLTMPDDDDDDDNSVVTSVPPTGLFQTPQQKHNVPINAQPVNIKPANAPAQQRAKTYTETFQDYTNSLRDKVNKVSNSFRKPETAKKEDTALVVRQELRTREAQNIHLNFASLKKTSKDFDEASVTLRLRRIMQLMDEGKEEKAIEEFENIRDELKKLDVELTELKGELKNLSPYEPIAVSDLTRTLFRLSAGMALFSSYIPTYKSIFPAVSTVLWENPENRKVISSLATNAYRFAKNQKHKYDTKKKINLAEQNKKRISTVLEKTEAAYKKANENHYRYEDTFDEAIKGGGYNLHSIVYPKSHYTRQKIVKHLKSKDLEPKDFEEKENHYRAIFRKGKTNLEVIYPEKEKIAIVLQKKSR